MIINNFIRILRDNPTYINDPIALDLASIKIIIDVDTVYNNEYIMSQVISDTALLMYKEQGSHDFFESNISISHLRKAICDEIFNQAHSKCEEGLDILSIRILHVIDSLACIRDKLQDLLMQNIEIKTYFSELDRSSNYLNYLRKKNAL
jgi:delta-aminolevulinic acid dehydratase/porphobilinogen synthase